MRLTIDQKVALVNYLDNIERIDQLNNQFRQSLPDSFLTIISKLTPQQRQSARQVAELSWREKKELRKR